MPGLITYVYPVGDLARAKALYERLLDVAPYANQPYYVGFRIGQLEIGLDPGGHGTTGPVGYYEVDDIETALAQLAEAGAEMQQPATDVGGGKLIATVTDADGNVIGLSQSP